MTATLATRRAVRGLVQSVLAVEPAAAEAVLEWLGLAPAELKVLDAERVPASAELETVAEAAQHAHTSPITVHRWIRTVRRAAFERTWPDDLAAELTRPTRAGENHEQRRRIAHLMAVSSPRAPL